MPMIHNNHRPPPPERRYRLVLSAVHMVYRLVNSTYNARELSLRMTRLLCQFVKAHSARVILLEPEQKRPQMVAIFNNKINILLEKKKDLAALSKKELRVTEGYPIFTKTEIGLPMVADDNIGALFVRRMKSDPPFTDFDREMVSVFAEQSVTAIKNLQLYEQQQQTILGSIKFIDKLLAKRGSWMTSHSPVYFQVIKALAEKLHVNQQGIDNLYYASVLHDAGAIDVPYEALANTSQLSANEFQMIREWPAKSAELIRPVEFLRPILPIILYHHEKYDGTGYPSGLKKEEIPLGARIIAVVDAVEAMLRGRPWKAKLTLREALKELQENSGTQFDPRVVDGFLELCGQKKFRNYLSRLR